MAKTTAPMLSIGAAGSFAKTLVASRWRGVKYMRQHVVPANPRSTGQQSTRNVFSTMNSMWKIAPSIVTAPWDLFATGQPFVGRNAFIGQNVKILRGAMNMQDFIGSPGAKGGVPPVSIAITPGSGQLTVAFTDPTPPTGWTITGHEACCFKDQAPDTIFASYFVAAEDTSAPIGNVVLTGLTPATLHVVAAWIKWLKADGVSVAYSASLVTTGTPS